MNHVYKSVWCAKANTYVAASELAKGTAKSVSARAVVSALLLGGGSLGGLSYALAQGSDCDPESPSYASSLLCQNANALAKLGASPAGGGTGISFGGGSNAAGVNDVSIGVNSTASSTLLTPSLAIGMGAVATAGTDGPQGQGSIAIGANAQAVQTHSGGNNGNGGNIAIGNNSSATGSSSWGNNTVVGTGATTSGYDGVALGSGSTAAYQSTALGRLASASGNNALASGWGAKAAGQNATALGYQADAAAVNSVALGSGSTTKADLTKAAYNSGKAALAGTASTANGEVSLGSAGRERRMTNLAAGAADTDAVNVSQLKSEAAKVDAFGASTSAALGGGAAYNATSGALSAPSYALGNANSIAGTSGAATDVGSGFGKVDAALGKLSTQVSNGSRYFKASGLNDGTDDAVAGGSSIAIGAKASAVSNQGSSIAIGENAKTTYGAAIALGRNASAGGAGIAIGSDSSTIATDAGNAQVALGGGAKTTSITATALGGGALASAAYSVALGAESQADRANAVSLGSATLKRQVVNMSSGIADTDAVNVSQLKPLVTALGGGASFNSTTGAVTAPSYALANANTIAGSAGAAADVGKGFDKVDAALGKLSTSITNTNTTLADAVLYDSSAHDTVTLGRAGTAVQLGNVKAGKLAADSLDAVNGAQLFETNAKVAIIDGRVTTLEGNVMTITNGGGIKYFHTSSTKVDAVASGANSVAIGGAAVASGQGSVALGDEAKASAKGSIAIGQGANDNGRGAESYVGKYSGAQNDSVGTFAVGNAATGATRTISGVADGKEANDAVNLRQLDGAVAESKSYTDGKVSEASARIEGNITQVGNRVTQVETNVNRIEGNVTNLQRGTDGMAQVNNSSNLPKPKVTGANAAAFGAGAEATGANSLALGASAKAQGLNSVAIGANSLAERDNSVAVGSAGAERQITHLAAGTQRTDAVNLGQMQDALGSLASTTDSRLNSLKRDLKRQESDLSAGIAGAIAIASLSQPVVNGGSTTAVGIGTYNGQSAVSVGVSHMSSDGRWTTKLGGSSDTQGRFSAGASMGYNW